MDYSRQVRLDCDISSEPVTGRAMRYALAIDLEPATTDLVNWWLSSAGLQVRLEPAPAEPPALVLVELAYPRQDDRELLRVIANTWPEVPVILLSPTFFAATPCHGEMARRFGVAATMATPLCRDRLVATIRDLLGMSR
jgi:DNA-binding NarL/FixJ family response regulator